MNEGWRSGQPSTSWMCRNGQDWLALDTCKVERNGGGSSAAHRPLEIQPLWPLWPP
jgi:hypothetical protein